MKYQQIVQRVAEDLELPEEIIETTYRAYWKAIKEIIEGLPLKDVTSLTDAGKVNINLPSLGKLCCTDKKFNGIKEQYKYLIENSNVKD